MRSKNAFTLVELIVVLGVIFMLLMLLLPATRGSREAARRNACVNNLKQIALAILNHEAVHGFPTAYSVDEEQTPLHSWRTQVLPYLEYGALHESIDLSKPWNDQVNTEYRETEMQVYLCPSSPAEGNLTTYLGVTGEECFFHGATIRTHVDIQSESRSTITVVDVTREPTVQWMNPQDVSREQFLDSEMKEMTYRHGAINAAFLDGHVSYIKYDIDKSLLSDMLSIKK